MNVLIFCLHRPVPEKISPKNSERARSAAAKPEHNQSIGCSGAVLGFCLCTPSSFPSKLLDALSELYL